ncbi:SLC13 family permease [Halalkalibacter alkalisediminis]|uniref:SLC13 family permease n=1 Tax=Halalkalibacter alkalisediminis TaxID=935616 RepID=A0ABV6NNP8_9BACI|nr:SLC13 family permease [Halalkalibacter alkalisediminis]
MSIEAITISIVLLLMFFSLVKEYFPPEITVFTALSTLVLLGVIPINEALEGFSNPAVHTIALLMVIAYAAQKSGVVPKIITKLLGRNKNISVVLLKIMLPVSFLSAFMNNTPIVAMLTPIVHKWGIQHNISPSKLLIPLSYAAIVGGTVTLIGTSTNLLVHGLLQQAGHPGFSMFQFSLIGVPLFVFSLVYMIYYGHKQLPNNKDLIETYQSTSKEYTIEVRVTPASTWIGKTVRQVNLRALHDVFLIQINRDNNVITPASHYEVIQANDVLIFSGNIDSIMNLNQVKGLILTTPNEDLNLVDKRFDKKLVEVVISHSSPLVNQKIKETNFRAQYNSVIVAVRKKNQQISSGIGNIIIKPGDTLLLLTGKDFIKSWSNSRHFYLVSGVETSESSQPEKAKIIIPTLLGVIVLASLQLLPILKAALVGIIILAVTKSITASEAKKTIDWGILILIASAIGIANAVEQVGLPMLITNLLDFEKPVNIILLCFFIYLATLIMTEMISNIAAAALMFPIAIPIATQFGYNPELFAIIIAIASSCSFITPIGYQTNLLVYGPGGYKFTDFFKVGLPLSLLCMFITVYLAVFIWG